MENKNKKTLDGFLTEINITEIHVPNQMEKLFKAII